MSNIHEYVVFDRAKLDPVLAMKWSALEEANPEWGQWESAREFLVDYALDDSQIEHVDEILARKTVRATFHLSDTPFLFFYMILAEKGLEACRIEIDRGDFDYGNQIVSCAGAAFVRGDISLAALTAVCDLHASYDDLSEVLLPDTVIAIHNQPVSPPMIPGFPELPQSGADCIGVSQSRRVIDFLSRAWRERWPIFSEGQSPSDRKTIRSCDVANRLTKGLRRCHLAKPCMFRWFEC